MVKFLKRRTTLLMLGILMVQLALSLYIVDKKNYLFFDEVFSYASANNPKTEYRYLPENQWLDESWYVNYMGVQKEHQFEYQIPYNNQVRDVHPPLFYFFLHTACSLVPGRFSYLAGATFNIIFFLCSSIVLYFLGKELFGYKTCGLITSFLFAISYGGLNTMVFVRMYMLLTLMVLLHSLIYVKFFSKEEISLKAYVFLGISLVGGVLTQYYFLFVAFLFGTWFTVRFSYKKQYKNLIKYLMTIALSAGVSLSLWPSMISHLFYGSRGKEAQSSMLSLEGYYFSLKEMFRILNDEMFHNYLRTIIIVGVILVIITLKNHLEENIDLLKKIAVIIYVCLGYYLIVSKVSPYLVERYIMPIYPLVYLLVVGTCYVLAKRLIPHKIAAILCIIIFGSISVMHMKQSGIPYTYEHHRNNRQRHEIVEQYHDNYALYISDNKSAHFYDAIQMLKEYKGFYYVYDLENIEQAKKDFAILENEDALIVYVKDKRTMEESNEFIGKVFSECVLDENSLLDVDEKWSVYYLNLN